MKPPLMSLIFFTTLFSSLPGVRGFLSWRLIWTDSGLLIYLRASVPQDNFGGDVTADGFAVAEQDDAGFIRSGWLPLAEASLTASAYRNENLAE
jgi:hypothetical protein